MKPHVVAALAAVCIAGSASTSALRGLAEGLPSNLTLCEDIQLTQNLTWTYDWSASPGKVCDVFKKRVEFVPMLWGTKSVLNPQPVFVTSATTAVLGFNEPNHVRQSNILPHEAAQLWPKVEAIAKGAGGLRIGSPAAAPCGGTSEQCLGDYIAWFDQFFGNCTGCKVDFLATHYYGCSTTGMRTFLESLYKYKLPLWLTEFNCSLNATAAQNLAYMKEVLPILDANPLVERYAWFDGRNVKSPGATLIAGAVGQPGMLTDLGRQYCAT